METNQQYDKAVCDLKHTDIDRHLLEHDMLLKEHGKSITDLQKDNAEYKIQIANLCVQIQNLIRSIRWGIGIFLTGISIAIAIFK